MPLPTSQILHRAGQWPRLATARVVLGYDAPFLRRKRLTMAVGELFLVDLPETANLLAGDAFELDDGRPVEMVAAEEPVLVIRADHVLADMLRGLGAAVTEACAQFTPEGGAYGLGRTMGHAH